jgi:hypothetical protein
MEAGRDGEYWYGGVVSADDVCLRLDGRLVLMHGGKLEVPLFIPGPVWVGVNNHCATWLRGSDIVNRLSDAGKKRTRSSLTKVSTYCSLPWPRLVAEREVGRLIRAQFR